jgi:hypothetical protein
MPEQVIAGAARFQDALLSSEELRREALQHGVLSFGVWGLPTPPGAYQVRSAGAGGAHSATVMYGPCVAPSA